MLCLVIMVTGLSGGCVGIVDGELIIFYDPSEWEWKWQITTAQEYITCPITEHHKLELNAMDSGIAWAKSNGIQLTGAKKWP